MESSGSFSVKLHELRLENQRLPSYYFETKIDKREWIRSQEEAKRREETGNAFQKAPQINIW
jgi:hypothetical protein